MVKNTVILTNNATGKQYLVSEEDAEKTMANPLLKGVYSKSAPTPIPEEIKTMRNATKVQASGNATESGNKETDTGNPGTKRDSAGNDNK